jgi:hypothetical protein
MALFFCRKLACYIDFPILHLSLLYLFGYVLNYGVNLFDLYREKTYAYRANYVL